MSQEEFGEALGMSQGNVSHYECQRQEVPPDVARRIIVLAKGRGQEITFEQIYASPAVE
ncbi:MAG: helix-turn-helix transcriptional regulator [Rhodocyclaceae bacterium]|nr:helix-turn-helix transcriptional regulator [Rhodocyclaceae bacterium]